MRVEVLRLVRCSGLAQDSHPSSDAHSARDAGKQAGKDVSDKDGIGAPRPGRGRGSGTSRLSVSKHAECYHAGDDSRRVIQGMVELASCMAILGAGAG